jgi:hypothetical protein
MKPESFLFLLSYAPELHGQLINLTAARPLTSASIIGPGSAIDEVVMQFILVRLFQCQRINHISRFDSCP